MGKEKSKRHQRVTAARTIKPGEVNGVIIQDEPGTKLYLLRQETEAGPRTRVTLGDPYQTQHLLLSDAALRGLVAAVKRLLAASK